ncbi:hypothetical protein LTR28_005867 [Elasticomyces elasticus]|nr:hypothetical protein LTR28_005867 [Elasticomyces elasticus]
MANSTPSTRAAAANIASQHGTSTFLDLSPTQSATFPPPAPSSTTDNSAAPNADKDSSDDVLGPLATPSALSPIELAEQLAKKRRSSSTSSASSAGDKTRFLKLGPVHFGGEPGVGDFAEE